METGFRVKGFEAKFEVGQWARTLGLGYIIAGIRLLLRSNIQGLGFKAMDIRIWLRGFEPGVPGLELSPKALLTNSSWVSTSARAPFKWPTSEDVRHQNIAFRVCNQASRWADLYLTLDIKVPVMLVPEKVSLTSQILTLDFHCRSQQKDTFTCSYTGTIFAASLRQLQLI